ncbi:MAG: helix-turn-helix transcriptional regulator [Deltaproteobacteria bacterium]|nr:helix-turn-helix transcriptional regulator [Deltaproteobacteria bacterium]
MTEQERTTLQQRLRELLASRGLSVSALARQAGLSKGYVSQLLSGKASNPSVEAVSRMAEALGVTRAALLGDERSPGEELALPAGLLAFLQECAARGMPLSGEDVQMLAGIRYRGRQPQSAEDWAYLYESIRRSIR